MKNMFGEKGYAFPEIISAPIIDDETRIVDIEFRVTPGNRSKVRTVSYTHLTLPTSGYVYISVGAV